VDTLDVECLRCGERHRLARPRRRSIQRGECPRCGYVGWAPAADRTERPRRELRSRPVEVRRLRLVV
jgi:ribosomal protein S27AE